MTLRTVLFIATCLTYSPLVSTGAPPADQAESSSAQAELRDLVFHAKRIVFLGDSITYRGSYVAYFEAWLLTQNLKPMPTVINVGLPSETVSGLSEQGHAGGRFPRPALSERLQRVLDKTKPDLVFACYGINCGIYQPFDETRFKRYQRGIEELDKVVKARGAQLVLLTPPMFDDQVAKKEFSYNNVLDRYSDWLLSKRKEGWLVIDVHGPMMREVARRRQTNPDFTFQRDAVHPNTAGHWLVTQQLIRACSGSGATLAASPTAMLAADHVSTKTLRIIEKRMALLRNAYLTAAGHQRPGIAKGLPLEEAQAQAAALTAEINRLAAGLKPDGE